MTLEELRDALANATGPDHELDRQIAIQVLRLVEKPYGAKARKCWWYRADGKVRFYGPPDRFTGSIDAAVTLVPDGAEYTLSTLYGIADFECPLNGGDADLPLCVRREDGNVAVAICQWRVEYELQRAATPDGGRDE